MSAVICVLTGRDGGDRRPTTDLNDLTTGVSGHLRDDGDETTAIDASLRLEPLTRVCRRYGGCRQGEPQPRHARRGFRADAPAGGLHQLSDDGQPDPRSAALAIA